MTTFVQLKDYPVPPAPTFELPPDIVRKNLREGQLVKCCFEFKGQKVSGERMWIQVTQVLPEGVYVGKLRNDPQFTPIAYDETINFTWQNVICVAD